MTTQAFTAFLTRWQVRTGVFLFLALLASTAPTQAGLLPGTILVLDDGLDAVIAVDPSTGNRTVFSDLSDSTNGGAMVGTGIGFSQARSIAVDASGNIFVADTAFNNRVVISVDPSTGNRSILSGSGSSGSVIGAGVGFDEPTGIHIDAGGRPLVVDAVLDAVLSVDPLTGDRTILSARFDPSNFTAMIGTGVGFGSPRSVTTGASGEILVADFGFSINGIVSVDPSTGDRTFLSGTVGSGALATTVGAGVGFDRLVSVATDAAGNLLALDAGLEAVISVDLATGNRTVISDFADSGNSGPNGLPMVGAGVGFNLPESIAVGATGELLVVDRGLGAVISVDPVTGDRTVLSDASDLSNGGAMVGTGVGFVSPASIAVVIAVVPEPSSLTLLILAGFGQLRRRR